MMMNGRACFRDILVGNLFSCLIASALPLLAPSTAHAEDDTCEGLRSALKRDHDGMEVTGPEMDKLSRTPGIAAAIKRQEIAKRGFAFAYEAYEKSKYLQERNCLDFVGRKTDWSKLIAEAHDIAVRYAVQAKGP